MSFANIIFLISQKKTTDCPAVVQVEMEVTIQVEIETPVDVSSAKVRFVTIKMHPADPETNCKTPARWLYKAQTSIPF